MLDDLKFIFAIQMGTQTGVFGSFLFMGGSEMRFSFSWFCESIFEVSGICMYPQWSIHPLPACYTVESQPRDETRPLPPP